MFLAIFPLQLAIFPGEEVPLHIFEPRYKQLIVECRDEGITFGIPTHVNGRIARYGTEVRLKKILKTGGKRGLPATGAPAHREGRMSNALFPDVTSRSTP